MKTKEASSLCLFLLLTLVCICALALVETSETELPGPVRLPVQTVIQLPAEKQSPHSDAPLYTQHAAERRAARLLPVCHGYRTGLAADGNGLPLNRDVYHRAAYIKCPPEGLPG